MFTLYFFPTFYTYRVETKYKERMKYGNNVVSNALQVHVCTYVISIKYMPNPFLNLKNASLQASVNQGKIKKFYVHVISHDVPVTS